MTDLLNPRWADAEHASIRARRGENGPDVVIPAVSGNRDFDAITESGAGIAPYRRWDDPAAARADLVEAVKAEANARVIAIMPEWKQRNALAQALAMVRKVQLGETLTAREQAAEAAFTTAWTAIQGIRAASDAKELEIAKLADLAEAEAYDVKAGWPA